MIVLRQTVELDHDEISPDAFKAAMTVLVEDLEGFSDLRGVGVDWNRARVSVDRGDISLEIPVL